MSEGRITGNDLVDDSAFKRFQDLDDTVKALIRRMGELEGSIRSALSPSGVSNNSGQFAQATRQTTSQLSEQEKVLREINRLRERNNDVSRESLQALARERTRRNQVNRELRREAELNSDLGDSYTRLRRERDRAAATLRNLVVDQKASTREVRQARLEFDRLNTRVRRADRAIGNFRDNVGNYGSALGPVVRLTRDLVFALGLYSAIDIGRTIFEQIKLNNELRVSLEQVTETQEAFNRSSLFVEEVAERSGAAIDVLTRRYVNFFAAARQTNLTLGQTEDIFEAVVLAGAALGRSQDDINGSLRALEQILSKGRVQAEELRGQLGERLPGAFQILEKALGLANGELNDLLETGGLLSTDAIPALTQGLNEAFSLETIDRVQTLTAEQGRLRNEWLLFIGDLDDGEGTISRVIGGLFRGLTSIVELLRQFNGGLVGEAAIEGDLQGVQVAIDAVTKAAAEQNITLEEAAEQILPRYNNILNEYGEILSGITQEQGENSAFANFLNVVTGEFDEQEATVTRSVRQISLYRAAIEALEEIIKTGKLPSDIEDFTDATEENANTLAALRERLRELRQEFENTEIGTARFRELQVEIKAVDDEIRRLTGSYKENTRAREEVFEVDSIASVQSLISTFEKLQNQVTVGSAAWLNYAGVLREAREELERLQDAAALANGDLSQLEFITQDDLNLADEIDDFLNNEGLNVILSDFADRFKLSRQEIIDEYIELYGRDFEAFKQFEEQKLRILQITEQQKLQTRQRALDLADALSESFLQIQLDRLDAEQERQNEIFDSVANNKESSEQQIALAEEKREENEKRLDEERRKRERNAFLFRQALSVADIFLADALARANAVASTAAIVPYIPLGLATLGTLQALISTNTALALATVLAQSLPAFFYKGKSPFDNYEGFGVWGEYRREARIDKAGNVDISPDKPTITYVKSDDIIMKSMTDFNRALANPNSEVFKRVSSNMYNNNQRILTVVASAGDSGVDYDKMTASFMKAIRKTGMDKRPVINVTDNMKVTHVP